MAKTKRILPFLLILALVCAVLPALPAHAEIPGKLYICGEEVTDENCADVLGNGRFSYDPAENVLTIRGSGYHGKYAVVANYIPGLTIYVARDVTLRADHDTPLLLHADTTITGPGLLTAEGDYGGIHVDRRAKLTIRDANVDARGRYWGIDATTENDPNGGRWGCYLSIKDSYVHATAEIYGAVTDFMLIGISGCTITEPEDGHVVDGSIRDKDGKTAKSVTIEPPKYELWIAGKQVTGSNRTDVLCSGAFSYDPAANVLTVKGDCTTEDMAIRNEIEGLTVYVEKDSRLESTGPSFTVTSLQDLRITGPGRLSLISATSGLAVLNDHTLTLENAKLRVSAAATGVTCTSEREKLVVRSSELEVQGGNRAFGVFEDLTLEGCSIIEPADGECKNGTILDGEGNHAKKVKISEVTYPLWIAGTQVHEANAADVLGDGAFAYDPYTNTLSVRDDCHSSTDSVINNQIPGLTLFAAANATLESDGMNAITTSRDMTITGPGRLLLLSVPNSGVVVRSGATLTIESAYVEVDARIGLSGWLDKEKLVVRNSVVSIDGKEVGIFNFTGGIALEGCEITVPEGALVETGTVTDKDGNESVVVTIEPQKYALEIAGTPVDTRNASDVLGDGAFSFDAAERLLTVRGDCTCAEGTVIYSKIAGLTIYAKTDATLRTLNGAAISGWGNFCLTGPGKLTLEANYGTAVAVGLVGSVAVENATLELIGNYGFLGGSLDPDSTLTVRNSAVTVHAMSYAIYSFSGGVSLEGCEITAPKGTVLTSGSSLDKNGNPVKELTIEPAKYDLSIAGTQVDTRNAADVLGNGRFAYDADTNVLTVSGSCFNKGSYVIINGIDGLTLYVADNALLSGGTSIVSTSADLTITGPGMLMVESSSGCGILAENGATLTIQDASIIVEGRWGIGGTPSGESLILRNSRVHAKGTSGAVCDFDGGIAIEDCTVTAPAPYTIADGGIWDETGLAAEVYIAPGVSCAISALTRTGDTFWFALDGTVPAGAKLIVAAYEGGRLCALRVIDDLSADSFTLKAPDGAVVKAFLVSADSEPLCLPKTAH